MSGSPKSVQEQLIDARRNQILAAAVTVFAEKGFSRTTIRDIAKQAGIADGTIYNYFENKTALLLGILNQLNESDEREAHFAQSLEGDFETWVHEYLRHRLSMFTGEALQVVQVILSEVLINKELRELYYKQVIQPTFELANTQSQAWQEAGASQGVDPVLSSRVTAGAVLGLLLLRIMGDPVLQERWDELPEVLTSIFLTSLDHDQNEKGQTHE